MVFMIPTCDGWQCQDAKPKCEIFFILSNLFTCHLCLFSPPTIILSIFHHQQHLPILHLSPIHPFSAYLLWLIHIILPLYIIILKMPRCSSCRQDKPDTAFDRNGRGILQKTCRQCLVSQYCFLCAFPSIDKVF